MSTQASASTTPTLWKNNDFLKFWAGQTISVFGSAVTNLALPLTAVTVLNASPAQMGFLNTAGSLPYLLVGLFAGVWIDRRKRRPIMLAADLGRALLVGLIPLSMLLGMLRMEMLYAIMLLAGVLSVFFDVAYMAFLPALVQRSHLVEGNSKMEVSYSAAAVAGPGLAGWLIQLFSAPLAITLDALSFLVSAFSLGLIQTAEAEPEAAPNGERNLWKEIREGLQVVFGNRALWSIAGCTGTYNFFFAIWTSIYVLYLTRNLNLSPTLIGLVLAAAAPGALLASLVVEKFTRRIGLGPTIVGGILLGGASRVLILFANGPLLLSLGLLILSGFLGGFGNVVYDVNQVSLRQSITPDRLLGRMNASMRFLVWGTLPLGGLASSALSTLLGVWPTLLVGILGSTLAFLWVLLSPVRALKKIDAA